MAKKNIRAARTMSGPKKAAEFLREFPREEQVAEIQAMLAAGGHTTNLAHGIAIELKIADDEEIEKAMGKKGKKSGGGGGKNSIMNGRALFTYNPDLFKDDDGDGDDGPTNAKNEEEKQADDDGEEDGQEAIQEEDNEDDDQIKENGTTDNAQ